MKGDFRKTPVLVEWVDSFRGVNWEPLDDSTIIPPTHFSVGWIEKQDKDYVKILPHVSVYPSGHKNGFGDMTIPRCAIKKITKLK